MFKIFVITLLTYLTLTMSISTKASPVETFKFKDEVTKIRFQTLTKELRCPKCQNQDLADSNSPIAADLRKQIYAQLTQGKSDQEIVGYMVDRYGEFVLYRPRVSSLTYVLWFGPAVILLFGAIIVVIILRSRNNKEENTELSNEQQQKLKKLLHDENASSSDSSNSSPKEEQH
ncbi:MAG: cytochrome c-type biogenesis protein CcmH [Gammaproteobacteria bacterium]|nr:MAG: cytochrome c-type biogenesis protein CcmH [Gammaproteobacteria bacterium]